MQQRFKGGMVQIPTNVVQDVVHLYCCGQTIEGRGGYRIDPIAVVTRQTHQRVVLRTAFRALIGLGAKPLSVNFDQVYVALTSTDTNVCCVL